MESIISIYRVADSNAKEVWFIPKVNTDVFRDGNGVPLIRREVHEYTTFGKYKTLGCDNTVENDCPLCSAWAEGMYKISKSLEETRKKIAAYGVPEEKIDTAMQLFKQHAYGQNSFKKQDYVYMVVAVLDNYFKDEMNGTEFIPGFTMKLVRMTVDTYNRDFRAELLAEDNGVLFDVTYENTENIIDKSKSRKVTKSNIILSSMQKFEKRVVKEFRSLHMLDLTKLKPELNVTNFSNAKSIAESAKRELDESISKTLDNPNQCNLFFSLIKQQQSSEE